MRLLAAGLLAVPAIASAQHHGHGHHHHHHHHGSDAPAAPAVPAPVVAAPAVPPPAASGPIEVAPPPTVPTVVTAPTSPPEDTGSVVLVEHPPTNCMSLGGAAPQDDAQRERWRQGREHHTVACRRELLSQPADYNGARTEYQRAYDLYEGHPERYRFLGNVGRCEQALGQYEAALEAFRRFLAESPAEASGRSRVEGMIGALEATLGTVTLVSNVRGAQVSVDNREVGAGLGHVRVPMGRHVVELRAPGYSPARQEVQLGAMETVSARFVLEPLGRRGVSPVFFWTSAGVAVAAAAVGGVYGGRAISFRSDITARQESADERAQYSVTAADGERLQLLSLTADIFFGAAALFGVGATVLAFLTDFRGSRSEAPRTAWMIVPAASQGGRGASLAVRF